MGIFFSIRGGLAFAIGVAASFKILRNPYFGLLFFLFLLIIRPHDAEVFPGLETLPLVKYFVILIMISLILNPVEHNKGLGFTASKQSVLMLLFAIVLLTSGSFSAITFSNFNQRFLPILIFFFMITYIISEKKKMRTFIMVYMLLTTFVALYGIYNYYSPDGRVEYDSGIDRIIYFGILEDPNDLALLLVSSIPFAITLMLSETRLIRKAFFSFITVVHIVALTFTASRGGFMAFLASMAVLSITGKRKTLSVLTMGIFVVALLIVAPWGFKQRVFSFISDVETSKIDESSLGRLELWEAGYRMTKDYPVSGVGMLQFPEHSLAYLKSGAVITRPLSPHNSFVQSAAEAGLPGLFCYTFLLFFTFWDLFMICVRTGRIKEGYEVQMFSKSVFAGFTGIVICSFFLSQAYNWFFYIFIALAVSLKNYIVPELAYLREEAVQEAPALRKSVLR